MNVRSKPAAALLAVAFAGLGPVARAADPQDQEPFRKQLEALQRSVQALQQRLDNGDGAGQAAGPAKAATASSRAPAPAPAGEVTQDDLNGVRADLENFKYQYGREREYNTALANRPVNVSGTLQTRASYVDKLAPTAVSVSSNRTNASFANGAASLQFTGNLYKDYEAGRNLAYLLRAAAASSGGVNLQFASLTYNFLPTLSPEEPRLTLALGQQIVPFGLDVAAPDELKPTITSAQFAALFPNAVDLGALLKGEVGVQFDYGYSYRAPVLTYWLGAVNGSGANRNDDNGTKDLFGRLLFTVPAEYNSFLRQLAIGVSGYKGTQNTTYANAGTNLSGTARRDRLGADVYYNHHPFGVTYEYVRGWDGKTFGATAAAPGRELLESEGHVATLYYTFGEQFLYQSSLGTASISQGRFDDWWPKSYQPFVRFDTFDPNRGGTHDAAHGFVKDAYTAGFNVFFAPTTKFQLNAIQTRDQNPASTTPRVNQLLAQLQFGF